MSIGNLFLRKSLPYCVCSTFATVTDRCVPSAKPKPPKPEQQRPPRTTRFMPLLLPNALGAISVSLCPIAPRSSKRFLPINPLASKKSSDWGMLEHWSHLILQPMCMRQPQSSSGRRQQVSTCAASQETSRWSRHVQIQGGTPIELHAHFQQIHP